MTETLRGADLLARTLARAGTRYLFSLSGNHVMSIYDAALEADLDIIHVRHEGAAVHMADAWGRLTGEPGVALVTGGPGHANALGALYTAAASDSPLVLLSGHAPTHQLGMDAFQEMRQADIAAPLVKAAWTAASAAGLGEDIARALRIARAGRPGPVHVSLPCDLLEARIPHLPQPAAEADLPPVPLEAAVAAAIAEQLHAAKRALVLTGPMLCGERHRGVREALARAWRIPVIGMESPRGVNDPALGALAEVLRAADLVVLLAKKLDFTLRFGRSPAFAADCRFIVVDPEAATLERAARAAADPARLTLAAIADPFRAAAQLSALASAQRTDSTWADEVEAALGYRPPQWDEAGKRSAAPVHPVEVGRAVQQLVNEASQSVVVIDGGEFGQWAQACVEAPLRLINGPAGSIGSALPFALAAKLARPQAQVIALLGDGTFGFHMAEFDTAVRHALPILAVVGNDACWNAEHQIQIDSFGRDRAVGCELLPSRYDQAVAGLGGFGQLVRHAAELRPALEAARASGRPACVNVMVERLAAPIVSR
ncbi:MAG: thiamine pyrophosphate-binding protein [Burkholderiales bacterium]|nr:thiamine pyrophosphate-binding protein [Burkholderiales bacterium]